VLETLSCEDEVAIDRLMEFWREEKPPALLDRPREAAYLP
jgi:hypothetical protein